jgi:hypothetical protein
MSKFKYCKSCILPNTRTNLHINAEGICNACLSHSKKTKLIDKFIKIFPLKEFMLLPIF